LQSVHYIVISSAVNRKHWICFRVFVSSRFRAPCYLEKVSSSGTSCLV